MTETRFFEPGIIPEHTTADWYAGRDHAPHLDQPAHQPRLLAARDLVMHAAATLGVRSVSDLGCGDGGLLSLLPDDLPAWGYDLQATNVIAARVAHVSRADVLTDPVRYGDLSVATEMLEHLVDPHGFLRKLPSRAIVASSPNGETAQAHYEFHTWGWDQDGYDALLAQADYEVVGRANVPGFQVVLGARS